ncbi:MAG: tRNA guanosine(34) transglycosylase Tgt [Myxococcota bacterium]
MSASLLLAHGSLRLPTFLPDATRAVVRSVDAADLESCGVQGLVMNVFHLMQRPGSSTVESLGGLHRLAGWSRPILTDSGGFQAFSVLREDPRAGSLTDDGIAWRGAGGRRFRLTPEKSITLQLRYGADAVMCLDDCTHPDDPEERQALAVKRSVEWARRARRAFDEHPALRDRPLEQRPRLFAVVQGGTSRELRARCAAELLEIGFDGLGFGGWPLDSEGRLLLDTLAQLRELVPAPIPLHALGVGHPESVRACAALGYGLFDSALPTRDARRGRLYAFRCDPTSLPQDPQTPWFSRCFVGDARYVKADRPVSEFCDALCCRRYSVAYLHHLHEIRDGLYGRLATLHNLRFMAQLLEDLQGA